MLPDRQAVEEVRVIGNVGQQRFGGHGAQAANDFWMNDCQLPLEISAAAHDLIWQWIAIPRRPALEHVEDVDILAL